MTIIQKVAVLKNHRIKCRTNRHKTILVAKEEWRDSKNNKDGFSFVDMTDFNKQDLYDWLGY